MSSLLERFTNNGATEASKVGAVGLTVRRHTVEAKRRWPDGGGSNGSGKTVGLVANLDD